MNTPALDAGRLRSRVQLQSASQQQDELGGAQTTWSSYATTWAEVMPVSAREQYQATQFTKEVAYIITMRWRPGVLAAHRVQWTEPGNDQVHTFDIQGVINVDSRNVVLQLTCVERNDD